MTHETATSRYGDKLAGHLKHPADRKPDPDHVRLNERKPGKRKRYAAGSTNLRVDSTIAYGAMAAFCGHDGSLTEDRNTRLDIVKQVMDAVKPKNELEGMLAAQMIGAHAATMEAYGRAARSDIIPNVDTYLNQAAKASRTFAALLEALDRHRGKGGRQKVTVEHVHVYEGGQAVVGAIGTRGSRGSKRNQGKPHAPPALPYGSCAPLRCEGEDEGREPVPIAGYGERPLQDARGRQHGGTDR